MQITHSKLYRFVARYREIGASAIMFTFFANIQMAQAADGDLDPLFGGGIVMTDLGKSTDLAEAVAIQADGKLVVVGTTYKTTITQAKTSSSPATIRTARSTGPGQSTHSFPGLARCFRQLLSSLTAIVVAGGAFPLFTFAGNFKVARYNPNGSLDASFGDGGIVTTIFPAGSYAFDVALQSDG